MWARLLKLLVCCPWPACRTSPLTFAPGSQSPPCRLWHRRSSVRLLSVGRLAILAVMRDVRIGHGIDIERLIAASRQRRTPWDAAARLYRPPFITKCGRRRPHPWRHATVAWLEWLRTLRARRVYWLCDDPIPLLILICLLLLLNAVYLSSLFIYSALFSYNNYCTLLF